MPTSSHHPNVPRTYRAFVGTYAGDDSDGIYQVRVRGGDVERIGAAAAGENPSFLAGHSDRLYAVNETDGGTAGAFGIDPSTGELLGLNRQPTGGAGPCHCSVDATGEYLLVAHYAGGSVAMLPIDGRGRLGEPTDVVAHDGPGSGTVPDRQDRPHPHSVTPGPENEVAYVPDLGTDEVVIYGLDLEAGALERRGRVGVHAGAGPRHVDVHPSGRVAYLLNELDGTLSVFRLDGDDLAAVDTVDTLPESFDGHNQAADVHVHPSGRFVYCSNRGHDSIAVLETDGETGRTRLVDNEPVRGEWPRNFAIGPGGRFLFAVNQRSDGIVPFGIDDRTGLLEPTGTGTTVPRPACMVFAGGPTAGADGPGE